MQKPRQLLSLLTALALLFMAPCASALGWAGAQQSAVLGQRLDFSAVLRLDPGDSIAPGCVKAEVQAGDQRLLSSAVQVVAESSDGRLNMRVLSSVAINEPVVEVTLNVGCPSHMSRHFVLFADPPGRAPSASIVAAPLAVARIDSAAARAALPDAAPASIAASAPARPRAARPQRRRAASHQEPRHKAQREPQLARHSETPPTRAAAHHPHLQLDAVEPVVAPPMPAASVVEDAIQAVAMAASAARAAASAASAADARIASLERSLRALRDEQRANRDLMAQMRERLAAAEGAGRWTQPLLLALVLLALFALWLSLRLRRLQQERQASWRQAAAAEAPPSQAPLPHSQLPMVTSELHTAAAPRVAAWPSPVPPARQPGARAPQATASHGPSTVAPPLPATPAPQVGAGAPLAPVDKTAEHERTLPLPAQVLPGVDGSPRDVTIEELLDLEQQAEFFIVLGQDDAAIDLLVDHLRSTGGGSPLPYLKLLEIYRRRGEREAYERTRMRFNHRFNAYAPDWDSDLQHGRSLDDYVGMLPRLQQVWARPLDAMAELEALLFRKSRGELFELPAYREVLFLYSLARDLLDREAADTGNIDLLLPLADGGEFSSTAPHPYFGIERESVFDSRSPDRPTAPIDLDLTQPDTQPMIVVEPQARP